MLTRKEKFYNSSMMNKLLVSIGDQQSFWETVHKVLPNRKHVQNRISVDEWFQHFKNLFETESAQDVNEMQDEVFDDDNEDNVINMPITNEEVRLALHKLKCKKAAGPDFIIGEMLKNAGDIIIPFYVTFFNKLFDRGIYPDEWTVSTIVPLFKKGDVSKPSNYRGISFCNISSKIFSAIINRRLQDWVEENNSTGEYQASFKRGYLTIDKRGLRRL